MFPGYVPAKSLTLTKHEILPFLAHASIGMRWQRLGWRGVGPGEGVGDLYIDTARSQI